MRQLLSVSERVTSEALPVEKLVDTMCHIEDILADIHDVMVEVHAEIAAISPAIERGIKQAQEGINEAEDVRKDIRALNKTFGEIRGGKVLNEG